MWMVECIPDAIAEELNAPMKDLDALLDKVDLELSMENRKLESRLYSASKTRMMLDRVNEAISMLRKNPDNGEEMYQIIYKTYIAQAAASVEEMNRYAKNLGCKNTHFTNVHGLHDINQYSTAAALLAPSGVLLSALLLRAPRARISCPLLISPR